MGVERIGIREVAGKAECEERESETVSRDRMAVLVGLCPSAATPLRHAGMRARDAKKDPVTRRVNFTPDDSADRRPGTRRL